MIRTVVRGIVLLSALLPSAAFADDAREQYRRERAAALAREEALFEHKTSCTYFTDCIDSSKSLADKPSKPYELGNSTAARSRGGRKSLGDVILQQLEPANGR